MDWREPGVWSAIIATVALVLSQLPPIRQLLTGKKIQITLRNQLWVTHFLGNVSAQFFIDIENVGGASVTIRLLDCFIMDDRRAWRLPIESYYSRQQQLNPGFQEIPFFPISLKPSEHWAEMARCYAEWSDSQEREVSDVTTNIRKDISAKFEHTLSGTPNALLPSPLVQADPKRVQEAVDFFDKNFWLHVGSYHFIVAAKSDANSALLIKGFSFLMLESQISTLKSHTDDYKFGMGIYLPVTDQQKIGVFVRLKPMDDIEAKKHYARAEKLSAVV